MPHRLHSIHRFTLLLLFLAVASTPAAVAQEKPATPAQPGTSLHLRWPGQQGVLRYRLQLAHDEQFNDIVFDRAVFGTEYVVSGLAPGRYFWRVAPAVKETGTFSKARPIEIAEQERSDSVERDRTRPTILADISGWRTTTGPIIQPIAAHLRSQSSLDLVGVNSDGMAYGIEGANGVALWSARYRPNAKRGEPTGSGGGPTFTPVLITGQDGLADVLVAYDGGVRLLDGATGRELWRAALKTRAMSGAVAAPDPSGQRTLLIASDNSNSLAVLSLENGKVVAEPALEGKVIAEPAAYPLGNGNAVVFALEGGMLDVRASTGERIRAIKMDTTITTPPLYVSSPRGGLVLVGTENGLISLSAENLQPLGRISTEGDAPRGTLMTIDLDKDGSPEVLMLTRRGRVVAIGTSDGKIRWYTSGATDAASTAFADLNQDGVLDVIVAAGQDFAHGYSGRDGSLLWRAEEEMKGSPSPNQQRALVTGSFGDGSMSFVVGTDPAGTGLRAVGLPKDSTKAARD